MSPKSEMVNQELENQKLHELLKQYREENKILKESIVNLTKINVEGKVKLQCGTTTMINPQFELILPTNPQLSEQELASDWMLQEDIKRGALTPRIDRPVASLQRVRIVAFLYTQRIDGREGNNGGMDERGARANRIVELYDRNMQGFRLD